MQKFFKKYPWIVFSLIAIELIYPSFRSGYIFSLDWTIKPFITLADISWSDPLGWIIYDFFSVIFTFAIFQRIFLFSLIFLAGLAGFRLAKNTHNLYAQYFSGLLLIFNPFVYARIIEQPTIVGVGSVVFFWFWIYLLEALEENNSQKFIYSAIIGGLAVSFFAHSVFFLVVIFGTLIIADYGKNKNAKVFFKSIFFFWLIVFVLNSNWIVASLSGKNTWVSGVANFTQADVETFQTRSIGNNSVYATVLALQGYWGEYQARFISIQENPFWKMAFCLIFLLVVFGLVKIWKKNTLAKSLVFIFLLAFILAVGSASPLFKSVVLGLYQNIPFYIGLREPQKWVVLLLFIYAYFGSWGVKYLLENNIVEIKKYQKILGVFCAILPVLFSGSIIRGMHEHVQPQNFPAEWQEAKSYFEKTPETGKILFFPWHAYLQFDFAKKNIINPAKSYFSENIIQGNNTEFGKVYSHAFDEQTLGIEKYINKKNDYASFSSDMRKMNIETVVLAKTEDWQKYLWLDETVGIKKVGENSKLIIYRLFAE